MKFKELNSCEIEDWFQEENDLVTSINFPQLGGDSYSKAKK